MAEAPIAAVVAATADVRQDSPRGGFKTPLRDLYAKALKGGTTHDKVAAARYYFACLEVSDMAKVSNRADPGQEGWATNLPSEAARKEVRKSIDTLAGYCSEYGGADFLAELKSNGQKLEASYFSLAFTTRPYQERFPHLVGVLSSPSANQLEFTVWATADLNAILQARYGLTNVQAGYATNLIVSKYVNDEGVREFYSTYECAVKLNCGSNVLSNAEERLASERAAHSIEALINEQQWRQLIHTK